MTHTTFSAPVAVQLFWGPQTINFNYDPEASPRFQKQKHIIFIIGHDYH